MNRRISEKDEFEHTCYQGADHADAGFYQPLPVIFGHSGPRFTICVLLF